MILLLVLLRPPPTKTLPGGAIMRLEERGPDWANNGRPGHRHSSFVWVFVAPPHVSVSVLRLLHFLWLQLCVYESAGGANPRGDPTAGIYSGPIESAEKIRAGVKPSITPADTGAVGLARRRLSLLARNWVSVKSKRSRDVFSWTGF